MSAQPTLGEEVYEIAAVLDQWYEPTATYFKVQTVELQDISAPLR